MKQLTLLLTMIGFINNIYSQSSLLWSKDFATGLNNYYSEYPSMQTIADTIKVIGRKNTANGQRLLIVKYNMLGDTLSTKTYGNDSVFNNTIIDFKFDSTNHVYILKKNNLAFTNQKLFFKNIH